MKTPLYREEQVYRAVLNGELSIDEQGRVWRLGDRRGNRWTSGSHWIPSPPRRAEHFAGEYFQVRVMFDRLRVHALAHRLVHRHFFGRIPTGMSINHRNGIKTDNRPENLELATDSEQQIHALRVLKRGRTDQRGTKNAMAKLTEDQVRMIRQRRLNGELLASIAADFGIAMQTVSRIARGDIRA